MSTKKTAFSKSTSSISDNPPSLSELWRGKGGCYFYRLTINGRPFYFILDISYANIQPVPDKLSAKEVKMPKYVASTLLESDVNKVADSMREAGANILGVSPTSSSKRTSGIIVLECTEEVAEKVKMVQGIRHFESEIVHHIPESS